MSQLVDASSGIHPRYSKYYIRRVRQSVNDPLTQFLIDQGVPHEPCVMKPESTIVFDFYIESPEHSLTTEQMSTIPQLELAAELGTSYATHTVSLWSPTTPIPRGSKCATGCGRTKTGTALSGCPSFPWRRQQLPASPARGD